MKSTSEKTFVELLQKHQNIVHKICRLYTNDVDAHNDLFQEISIQLWKAYPKFRGE
ncbi:RNA polymerase subunit sigma-70, partial [Flavobacteriaceae bacterium]|nr:RNA polymerase subunit sigma-70 [Flavobacteriaceae bacterium]